MTMTNNPTIDGLDRETLAFALGFKCHGHKNRTDQQADKQNALDKIRALLDAPAVERQEPVTMKRQYLTVPGLWIECADDDPQAMTFYKQTPEVAALQSTIARLEARVAELESGRGEFIHQVRTHGSDCWEDISGESLEVCQCQPEEYEIRKLFTAPPAPVAVVLPDRKPRVTTTEESDSHVRMLEQIERNGWNACLDATAALNGERK